MVPHSVRSFERIAVTLGDPRGIGPEVAVGAVRDPLPSGARVILVGPSGAVDSGDLELVETGRWKSGSSEAEAGRMAGLAIEKAVELALLGEVDAIATAPISKPALAAAGYGYPGHTEMLGELAGAGGTALCLASETSPGGSPLRVVLVTGHMPLRRVLTEYNAGTLESVARLADEGLRHLWGIAQPRLAVCGLNPHASDGGLFGDEEGRICEPVIARLSAEGLEVSGPYPADTAFVRAMSGEFDAVLAPYHDVGMTAIKSACFGSAVNVTLGLPFPRTSPDHGTAFDIARSGRADSGSMRAAIELAAAFARRALTAGPLPDRLAEG